MATKMLSENDLKRELDEFHERHPNLSEDEQFVLWFLRAFVTDSEDEAKAALCGGSGDKNIDALFIDHAARIVTLVQGKYRQKVYGVNEKQNDVIGFANVANNLCGDKEAFSTYAQTISDTVRPKLDKAHDCILKKAFTLKMFYVTTGKCSTGFRKEASKVAQSAPANVEFEVLDGKRIMLLLGDYLDGVAPPVPSLDLELESGSGIQTGGAFNRFDSKTKIDSWVFSMTDFAVASLFKSSGTRIFARNVRGFLGNTDINRGMESTLKNEPEYFWYYNNGITIICDQAEKITSRGRDVLRVANPQIINGQQTTRTLERVSDNGSNASVLVRVIVVPRREENHASNFEKLVTNIVAATNWQNAIFPSDLKANDRRQIEIESHLRKIGYRYIRKRMTKGEAWSTAFPGTNWLVKKEEIAQAVAACDLDPSVVREGKERLFEIDRYNLVFPNSNPNYYLSRYLLSNQVRFCAHGFPERAYAKWVVLNFMWSNLNSICKPSAVAEAFRLACEQREVTILKPVLRSITAVFVEALRFYRRKRGKGETAADVSTFFQRRNLHVDFKKYWKSPANRSRSKFKKAWDRFEKELRAKAAS